MIRLRLYPAPVLVGVRKTVNISGEISGEPEKKQKLLLDNLTEVSLFCWKLDGSHMTSY